MKDCQVDLIEVADCSLSGNEAIQAIEVQGEVIVKALVPGDSPKVQVKLALPEDFDDFCIHSLCIRPKNEEEDDLVYRMGNQKFGVATIIPPQLPFSLMQYVSREDKSLKLPFSVTANLDHRSGNTYDFECLFRMSQLQDLTSDEFYFPLIQDVRISFYFPTDVLDACLVSNFCNTTEQFVDST